jgi:hypothetical protein
MLDDLNTLLYLDCKQAHKKLRSMLELLQWKATNGISDTAFNEILSLIKKFLLEWNKLTTSTYNAKKVVCPLGLEV